MDVTRQTFHNLLPALIAAIADAHFVAIDLELSGIPGQQINRPRPYGEHGGGKPSLQQRYEETKKAAEKYQVLQLGITCVWENRDRGVYVVRPYNFFLNPVPDERLNVERIFSYQSGAVDFLLRHNFRMEAPFLEGVNYFSRAEEAAARRSAVQRQDRASVADIQPRDDDIESLKLLQRLQGEVIAWKNRSTPQPDFLNFSALGFDAISHPETTMNNYQKRLVHQFIRAEHPDLATISRPSFIQIVEHNKEREDGDQAFRTRVFEERLVKQVGLRWLVEAICGGDLSAINPNNFYTAVKARQERAAAEFTNVREQLMGQSTVLVGHNLFLDLIYFHACFFGPLPDKVEDFQQTIHELFPRIIDTKYLATHNNDAALARSSLEELDARLSNQAEPIIELHSQHLKYALAKPAHEAGFDSFMTAQVFVRLSTALISSGFYIDDSSDAPADEDGNYFTPSEGQTPEEGGGGALLDPSALPAHLSASENSTDSRNRSSFTSSSARSAFSHPTAFDLLGDIPSDEDLIPLTLQPQKTERPNSKKQEKRRRKVKAEIGRRMPAWESPFWALYGNKLRVNGTVEGVCDLGEWPY
ncbi:MAG: hypothetical protein Q9170_004816 [Blastenia crenularia]